MPPRDLSPSEVKCIFNEMKQEQKISQNSRDLSLESSSRLTFSIIDTVNEHIFYHQNSLRFRHSMKVERVNESVAQVYHSLRRCRDESFSQIVVHRVNAAPSGSKSKTNEASPKNWVG